MNAEPAIVIVEIGEERLDSLKDEVVEVYRRAFSLPPNYYDDARVKNFAGIFERHRTRAGFKFLAAEHGQKLVGFCYGYIGLPGQFWHDAICEAIDENTVNQWLIRDFEVCELAVLLEARRNGVATALLQALLDGVIQRTATLSTGIKNTPALTLYKKLGWKVIVPCLEVPDVKGVYAVLGLRLPGTNCS